MLKDGKCIWCEIGNGRTSRPGYWIETEKDRELMAAHHAEVQKLLKDEDDGA